MFFMVFFTLLVCEIAMGVIGILTMVFGTFNYRPGRPVTGIAAYIAGVLFMVPLAVVLPLTMALGQSMSEADAIGKEIVFRAMAVLFCFFGAYLMAALLYNPMAALRRAQWLKEVAKRKKKKKRRERDEEGPRRRRRSRDDDDEYDDEDDDETPRRRRRDEDDDDEDDDERPRRRHADDDDDRRRSRRPGPPPMPR